MSDRGASDPPAQSGEADAGPSDPDPGTPEDPASGPTRGSSGGDGPEGAGDDGGRLGGERPVSYLKWAGVAVLAVTALVALFGFYTGVSRAISVWVSRSYRPLVNAAFNLALLLAALGGIGLLLRGRD